VDVTHGHLNFAVPRELSELIDLHHLAAAGNASVPGGMEVEAAAVVSLVRNARSLGKPVAKFPAN